MENIASHAGCSAKMGIDIPCEAHVLGPVALRTTNLACQISGHLGSPWQATHLVAPQTLLPLKMILKIVHPNPCAMSGVIIWENLMSLVSSDLANAWCMNEQTALRETKGTVRSQ